MLTLEKPVITWDVDTAKDMAEHLAEIPGREARIDMLQEAYGFPRSWSHKHLNTLMNLTPEQMVRVLLHADPTGETAVRRADGGGE